MSFYKYLTINTILTFILLFIAYVYAVNYDKPLGIVVAPVLIVSVLSVAGFKIILSGIKKKKNHEFMNFVLAATFFRLILGVIANVLVILLWKPYSTIFVLSYFFSYFLLTSFEVYTLLTNLRSDC